MTSKFGVRKVKIDVTDSRSRRVVWSLCHLPRNINYYRLSKYLVVRQKIKSNFPNDLSKTVVLSSKHKYYFQINDVYLLYLKTI